MPSLITTGSDLVTMGFSFNFETLALSDDELIEQEDHQIVHDEIEDPPAQDSAPQQSPLVHSLKSVLETLKDVKVTFDDYTTTGGNIVYRRQLFDVRHQLMCEDDGQEVDLKQILINDNDTDLKANIYEGGFKSWECSYDVIDYMARSLSDGLTTSLFLDLGCGTALPSCFLFTEHTRRHVENVKYILSDYNYDVLRLVTVPNLLIHWASTLDPTLIHQLTHTEDGPESNHDELLITEGLIQAFLQDLEKRQCTIKLISGSWGREFNDLVKEDRIDYMVSSETIYSPQTLPLVAETILEVKAATTLVAAKNIYFGVGGSVVEFLQCLRNSRVNNFQVHEVGQLKRSIIHITP